MIFKTITNTKLFLLLVVLISTSCVSNSDEIKVPTKPGNIIPLTQGGLKGTWELYFFTKMMFKNDINVNDKYRITDTDGFSVTYDGVGEFYESNVFGAEVKRGKYLIGNKDIDNKNTIWEIGPKPSELKNAVFSKFKTEEGKDTVSMAWLSVMYDDNFKFSDQYNGTEQGVHYNVDDSRYYRHTVKAPNYYPSDPAFKKNATIELKDILGTWQFVDHRLRVDNNYYKYNDANHPKPDVKYAIDVDEEKMMFSVEGGVQVYRELIKSKGDVPNRIGEFRIVDDVVHMFTRDPTTAGPIEIRSWKLWLDEKDNTQFIDYDKYRYNKNVIEEYEEWSTWKRVK